jgi:hypothetical protein
MAAYARLLGPRTRMVAVTHVSNVLGTINPVADIVRQAHAAGAQVLLERRAGGPASPARPGRAGCDFYGPSPATRCWGPPASASSYGRREVLEDHRARPGRQRDDQGSVDRPRAVERPAVALRARHAAQSRRRWDCTPRWPISTSSGWTGERARARTHRALPGRARRHSRRAPIYGPRNPEMKGAVVAFNVAGVHPHGTARAAAPNPVPAVAVRAGHHSCAQAPGQAARAIAGALRARASPSNNTPADVDRLAEAVARLEGGAEGGSAGRRHPHLHRGAASTPSTPGRPGRLPPSRVAGGRILAVGSDADVLGYTAGRGTEVVELRGPLPAGRGFIDAHCHIPSLGLSMTAIGPARPPRHAVHRGAPEAECANERRPCLPAAGSRTRRAIELRRRLVERRHPNRLDWDAVAPEHPRDLHARPAGRSRSVSSRAL